LNAALSPLICVKTCKSVAVFFRRKENRAGWPGSYSVELRCGYITARRMLAPKGASGRFGQICSDATPRVSRKIGIARTMASLQVPFHKALYLLLDQN
jgi:hypothetical protein